MRATHIHGYFQSRPQAAVGAVVGLLLLTPMVVQAQGAGDEQRARELFDQGIAATREGRHARRRRRGVTSTLFVTRSGEFSIGLALRRAQ